MRQDADARRRPASKDLTVLRLLLPFIRPYAGRAVGVSLALLVTAGVTLSFGRGAQWLVDQGVAAGNGEALTTGLVVALGLVALLGAGTFARFYLVATLGERVVADIRTRVFAHLMALSPSFYEREQTGEILSRLTTDTTTIQGVVGSQMSFALRNLVMLVGAVILLVLTSPKLAGLVFLAVPLVFGPVLLIGRRIRRLSRAAQDRVAEVSAGASDVLHGIRTVQAYTQEDRERRAFRERAEAAFHAARLRVLASASMAGLGMFTAFAAVGVVFWIGAQDVIAGRMTGGELIAFMFYAVMVAGAVGALSEMVSEFQRAAGAVQRLFEILNTPPVIAPPAVPRRLPDPPRGAVAFEAVRFHYPTRPGDAALDGFSIEARPGETVALVGPSGAGKTTVFQLLLRFYDPEAGRVLVDGVDVRDIDPAELRRRVGLVAQDPTIFAASVLENIRYGRPDASEAEVVQAARAAYAWDFIERLPEGLDTDLGERGVRLSGGQRQRVAIARALLKDPAILLLDEATSALDAESERAVQLALEGLMRNRTTLIIAHRLATVQSADRIVVMDRGRVVATGTHADLVRQGGLYARLAALQFDGRPLDEAFG